MGALGGLAIGTAVYGMLVVVVEWRIYSGRRRISRSLLHKARPEISRRLWLLALLPICPFVLAAWAALTILVREANEVPAQSELYVHLFGIGVLLYAISDLVVMKLTGFSPLDGLGRRYLRDRFSLREVRLLLALRLPAVGLLWALAVLWFRN